MSIRAFGPMQVLTAALAAAALGCGQDPLAPTPGTTAPLAQATAAAAYTIRDLGTLGGISSVARGINNRGGVVGSSALAGGGEHAFLWRAGTMRDLGALAGGTSEAFAINDDDVIVGYSTIANGDMRAVRWQAGKKLNLGTLGGRNSMATAVNALGVIVGWSETATGRRHAFVWQKGVMRDLGTLGGIASQATGINRAGKIVGWITMASGGDDPDHHAVTWKDGVGKDLGTNGFKSAVAVDINTPGEIVGVMGPSRDAEGQDREFGAPFRFVRGAWSRLVYPRTYSSASAINREGDIAGLAIFVGSDEIWRGEAWIRPAGGTAQTLPHLADKVSSQANDINDFGTVVGSSATSAGWSHAVLWRIK